MMLMAASCPSKRLAAVTKRTLLVGRYWAKAWYSAESCVMAALKQQVRQVDRSPLWHETMFATPPSAPLQH